MKELRGFFERIQDDHRIGPMHISLYAVLLSLRDESAYTSFFPVNRKELMARSKILGKTTYYRCLNELAESGYIEYQPEHYPGRTRVCCLPFD
jgi:hypothetical protein